jgi:uncharacterized Zn finger protein
MKEKIQFLVKGSAKEPYRVQFTNENGKITSTCSCPAGRYSGFCKHRISIFLGESKGIVSDNTDDIKRVSTWIKDTEIESALQYYIEMKQLEENAKKEAKKAKKLFEDVMSK